MTTTNTNTNGAANTGTGTSSGANTGTGTGGGVGRAALLADVLAGARQEGRAALIGYFPAGFPTVDGAIAAATAMAAGGCDIIEIGLPHSDPVLDGPVIQTADDIALRGGVRIKDVLRTVREVHTATGVPVLCMTYWNPVDRYGVDRFAAELAAAGGAGCILPDLPVQESAPWRHAATTHDLATVFVVAPSSRDDRIAETAAAGTGFLYAASLMGVTGTRTTVGRQARTLVHRARTLTDLPVCVGLGVSTPDHATEVAAYADGVIVGSAFVQRVLDHPHNHHTAITSLHTLATQLATATHRRG